MEFQTKYILAGRPETQPEDLWLFATDNLDKIRQRVAENPVTPAELLTILARDNAADVRAAVAENAQTPIEILDELASDEFVDVRYSIAENPNMAYSILLKLTYDPNPYVSHRAGRSLRQANPLTPERPSSPEPRTGWGKQRFS